MTSSGQMQNVQITSSIEMGAHPQSESKRAVSATLPLAPVRARARAMSPARHLRLVGRFLVYRATPFLEPRPWRQAIATPFFEPALASSNPLLHRVVGAEHLQSLCTPRSTPKTCQSSHTSIFHHAGAVRGVRCISPP